ncbi:MAG: hypothetical protein NZL88_05805, partial [Gaiellaceae bacterium]|nr:hypothetical protein [Gaiellaceae bacterium]
MSAPGSEDAGGRPAVLASLAEWFETRAGGLLVPFAAAVLAFLVGGLVVLFTGNNPLGVYRAIFDGTGLNYLF